MSDMNEVTKIKYVDGYRYLIVFDDGTSDNVDFTEYLDKGPVFAPLRDLPFFQQARTEGGTIAWPNGADIAPESLYERIVKDKRKFREAMAKVADVEPEERDKL